MIFLPVVGNKVLVFNLDDVKKLRQLGIVGALSGTLAAAPQQNVFLGLPLQLSIEDVVWLVNNNHVKLVDNAKLHSATASNMTQDQMLHWNESANVCISDANQNAKLLAKLEKLNLSADQMASKKKQIEENSKAKNFVVIQTETRISGSDSVFSVSPESFEMSLADFLSRSSHRDLARNYQVYRSMKDEGFYLLPGIRFGGKYVGYPNDPLRYHAHYIVKPGQSFSLLDLVASGRLATGVKKVWVIASAETQPKEPKDSKKPNEPNEPNETQLVEALTEKVPQKFFSVEWAGFG